MSKKSVLCIASSELQVERIANQLKAAGFSGNDISVLFPDKTGTRDFAHKQHTKAPEGAAAGVGTGGVLGGGLAWLVGIGALAIPGVGPFIAARSTSGVCGMTLFAKRSRKVHGRGLVLHGYQKQDPANRPPPNR